MIKINWSQIVPLLGVVFTLFLPQVWSAPIDWVQKQATSGGFVLGRVTEPDVSLSFNSQAIPIDTEGYFLIGFERDIGGLHTLAWHTNDQQGFVELWIASREFNIQSIRGVDQNLVTPPASVSARIQRESALVNRARAGGFTGDAWRVETFVWPLFGRITGVYGSQRIYNGTPGNPHWGVDVAAPTGTPVYAPASGKITLAEPDLYFSGGTIVLDHGGGLTSSFLHLSALKVSNGQIVKQGDVIALVGSTGRSTGPHLDWRMNLNGVRVDAALWVPRKSLLCLGDAVCAEPVGINELMLQAWRINRQALLQRE